MEQHTTLKRDLNTLYPVADRVPNARNVHAKRTGEFRCPKKGEWYLSGAIIEAYHAPNDLTTEYHIAVLVKTKTETKTTVTEDN